MNEKFARIYLLNLLADNNEKIQYIEQTTCSQELLKIYESLNNNEIIEEKTDHSKITDYSVKESILNHNHLSGKHKYYIAKIEQNETLGNKAFRKYFKSQLLFNPIFLIRTLSYNQKLPKTPWNIKIFFACWISLCLSTIPALLIPSLFFIPLTILFSLSLMWYLVLQAPKQIVSDFLEITGFGLFMLILIPLAIPVLTAFAAGFLTMQGLEKIVEKKYKIDEDDHLIYKSDRWDHHL